MAKALELVGPPPRPPERQRLVSIHERLRGIAEDEAQLAEAEHALDVLILQDASEKQRLEGQIEAASERIVSAMLGKTAAPDPARDEARAGASRSEVVGEARRPGDPRGASRQRAGRARARQGIRVGATIRDLVAPSDEERGLLACRDAEYRRVLALNAAVEELVARGVVAEVALGPPRDFDDALAASWRSALLALERDPDAALPPAPS